MVTGVAGVASSSVNGTCWRAPGARWAACRGGRGERPSEIDRGDADVVARGTRTRRGGPARTVQRLEHALHHPAIDGADDGVLDGCAAEGAVLGDDLEFVAVLLGMGGESVRGEGVGD